MKNLSECYELENYEEITTQLNLENKRNFNSFDESEVEKQKINIYFISTDQKINHHLSCYNTDIFSEIIEQLYNDIPSLKDQNIYFIANGKVLNKYLNLIQNNITDDTHILINIEE